MNPVPRIVDHVVQTSPVEAPAYWVHVTLALLANDDAHVRVSQVELARVARVSLSTMRRCVRELIDRGLVTQVDPPNQRVPALLRLDGVPQPCLPASAKRTRRGASVPPQGNRRGASEPPQAESLYLHSDLEITKQPTDVGSALTAEPNAPTGRGIAGRIYKLKDPRPAQPFMAIVKIAEALLDAGNDPGAVERAMLVVPTISTRSVELELNRKPLTRTQPAPVDTEREAAGGIVQL